MVNCSEHLPSHSRKMAVELSVTQEEIKKELEKLMDPGRRRTTAAAHFQHQQQPPLLHGRCHPASYKSTPGWKQP